MNDEHFRTSLINLESYSQYFIPINIMGDVTQHYYSSLLFILRIVTYSTSFVDQLRLNCTTLLRYYSESPLSYCGLIRLIRKIFVWKCRVCVFSWESYVIFVNTLSHNIYGKIKKQRKIGICYPYINKNINPLVFKFNISQ